MTTATEPTSTVHPDLDRLLAYRAGELPDSEASRLQDHLVECRECADLVLEAALFEDPETHAPRVSDIEKITVWRALRKSFPRGPRTSILTAVAAALVLAVGVSVWMFQTRSLPAPGVESVGPIHDVFSASRVRSGAREPEPLEVPPGVNRITLILHPEIRPSFPSYAAEVVLPGGTEVRVDDLYRSAADGFHLGLSRQALTEGTVAVRLLGVDDGTETEIDRFEVPVYFDP